MRFFLLRHGQTLFNLQEKVQGHNDSPLTKLGQYQARCAGYGARNISFDYAYSGDTKRQLDTARIFLSENHHPVEVISDPHFREMGYGKYEGGSYYDMLNPLYEALHEDYGAYAGLYRHYDDMTIASLLEKNDETGRFEGSERSYRRFKEGLDQLAGQYKKGDLLISTSSFVICSVLAHLFPELKQKSLVDNASLTILGYQEDKYELLSYNDISYRLQGEAHYR